MIELKIRFTNDNPYGCYVNSEYDIHDTQERDDSVYYYFDIGDGRPVFEVTQSSIKGYAVIEAGESKDIFDKVDKEGNHGTHVREEETRKEV